MEYWVSPVKYLNSPEVLPHQLPSGLASLGMGVAVESTAHVAASPVSVGQRRQAVHAAEISGRLSSPEINRMLPILYFPLALKEK